MSSLTEIVAALEAGDKVRGVFQELSKPLPGEDPYWFMPEPTGDTYSTIGIVISRENPIDGSTSLDISSNRQCLRQAGGSPGAWLVSLEVLKKGN